MHHSKNVHQSAKRNKIPVRAGSNHMYTYAPGRKKNNIRNYIEAVATTLYLAFYPVQYSNLRWFHPYDLYENLEHEPKKNRDWS